MKRQDPDAKLPAFWALDVDGEPGTHDMGLTRDGSLVVSHRILDVLVHHRVERAVFRVHRSKRGGSWVASSSPHAAPRLHR